ncbi:MAG: carbamoyltransferase HypF [Firmicutes bacterium]|nr:carbamoyltransferase HypF [Bacillota bacterium]
MKTVKYKITGLVQGIGFRPYIKRLADELGVNGTVKNCGGYVEITASAESDILEIFAARINYAPLSFIDRITEEDIEETLPRGFAIIESATGEPIQPVISPDIATCGRCVSELFDRNNRRYRHPFISCTECGPRCSVIRAVPYDRCSTSMEKFPLCPDCAREYRDISDIRAHAQTIACNDCGPRLSYTVQGDPIEQAVKTLKSGGIVAVKDIGGYHFTCLAEDNAAAEKIRAIKKREKKPFAVMFADIDAVSEYAVLSDAEKSLLRSPARPIVLVKKKKDLPPAVCGESAYIGAMLPCNPVQHMLIRDTAAPLVMTSGNVSGEPIIIDDDEMRRLRENCELKNRERGDFEILSHDRDILTPLDDSVCRVICGKMQITRRARGYTPLPIRVDAKRGAPVLALGGDLKASFCLEKDGCAYMSQYFGDLEDSRTYRAWADNIDRLKTLEKIAPREIISDMHPLYLSARHAKADKTLQHHFAHMASVMAEHRLTGETLGFIFDGTGYGADGCVWGGEAIIWDGAFRRAAHLSYTELVGGDESARDAARLLDCYLISAGLPPRTADGALIKAAVNNRVNTARSSSMGRLFDAVSALLGICAENSYEGECAVKLEQAAQNSAAYPLELKYDGGIWDTAALIRSISAAAENGEDKHALARGFHEAVISAVCTYAENQPIRQIVLSGGVFANGILTEGIYNRLTARGFNVYINEQVPPNDGGIALGQAWYAANA